MLGDMHVVICDIDGCLSDHRPRLHLAENKEWDKYHRACEFDKPNLAVVMALQGFATLNVRPILMTGRTNNYQLQTERWLKKYRVPYHLLYMRPEKDFTTPDFELKLGWTKEVKAIEGCQLLCAIEDRQQVVDMWQRNDILCLQVINGDILK